MHEYDVSAPNARRYPRVIDEADIACVPFLELAPGIGMRIFLSRERDDARYFRQGLLTAQADHQPYTWQQDDYDQAHHTVAGWLRIRAADRAGREVVLEAGPGEHVYCPAGFTYTFEPHGEPYASSWTSAPSPSVGIWDLPEYSKLLTAARVNGGQPKDADR